MPEQTIHPSPEELSAFSLGQLPPDESAVVESHISECQPCCETMLGLSPDDTFVALLQEARQLPTDQTLDGDGSTSKPPSSLPDVPAPLAEHPRYEIVGLIGKGGMGDVYQARHRKMERTVALKVINRELVRKPEAVERFHREVKTAGQLSHPNVVTAYDADQAGDFHFMVMEYVDGVDLSRIIKDRGPLPVAEACDYVRQAAIGLQYAHERSMVHRDIKPHNLMVTADGTVKILDFGLASLAPEAIAYADTVEARSDLTAAGAIMGTPDFISPEQAKDARSADIRSDVYSLGATLYFLLSGQPPFADGSVMHKLKSHAQTEPEPLESLHGDIPADLTAIVSKMMAKAPESRFHTPAEVAVALTPFSRHDAKTALAKTPSKRSIITSVCFSAILALLAGVVFVVTDKGTFEIKSEFDDVQIVVSKGGEEYTVIDLATDSKVHRLPSGQYKVNLKGRSDLALSSDGFTLKRSGTAVVNVTLKEPQEPDGPRAASATASSDQSPETSLDSEMRAVFGRLQQGSATASDQDLVETRLAEKRAERAESRRRASAENLRQLGLGFHRFHETYHHLPSSQGGQIVFFDGTVSRNKPTQPYSWRVALLPFIGHAELFEQYHFDESWDSENNLKLLEKMPAVYRFPQSGVGSTTTCYAALVGEHTALAATKNLKFLEILDGTANTLLLVEAKTAIPWTKPEDLDYSPDKPLPAIGGFDEGGVNVLIADGSVRFLEHPIDEGRIRALASRDGRERIEDQKARQAEYSQPAESDTSAIRKTTAFLVEAAKSGDLVAVKAALESGVDPNGPGDQLTALHWAVAQRISDGKTIEPSPEIARRLIEAGANVNAKDYLGQTPLEWAATYAPPEVVTILIKAGADVNAESRYGTVLMAARRVEIAKLLIEAGADVNAGTYTSPLASAAKYGNAELIQLLVENGANVIDPKDPPIHWVGKPDAAKALLEAGADVNQRNTNGETALHLAKSTWSPNAETVKLLIEAGADVKAKNVTGATPLHAAVQMAKPEIAKLVIAAGADVDAKDKQGNTPLSLANASLAWARGQQQVDKRPYEAAVQVLVDAGAKDDGRTELQQAIAAGDLQRVKELIAVKVDVNQTGPQRITAVHIASDKGHAEILAALIEAGANVDIPDALGLRPLHLAANAETARLLIAKGAKVNSRMPSPLYMATMNGKADVVRELIQSETAVNDSDCGEILNWATFAGRLEVVKMLFELRDEDTLLKTPSTYSPLHVATCGSFGGMNSPHDVTPRQRLDIAKLLVEKGADVNARWGAKVNPQSGAAHMIDTTPLMFASSQGDAEMVKFLIDQQADAKAANASGQTALHFAAQHGHRSVVELLLDANADVNALTREAKTPLDVTQDAAVKILLIQKGGKTASEILKDSQG